MQTTTHPTHHGRTTEGTRRAKRPGHLFRLMTLAPPQATVSSLVPVVITDQGRNESEWERFQASVTVDAAKADEPTETPIVVGSEVHVLELVSGGVDTLGALVEATGLGRTTVQGRLKALVADSRLRIAQPARGGKPARYEVI